MARKKKTKKTYNNGYHRKIFEEIQKLNLKLPSELEHMTQTCHAFSPIRTFRILTFIDGIDFKPTAIFKSDF